MQQYEDAYVCSMRKHVQQYEDTEYEDTTYEDKEYENTNPTASRRCGEPIRLYNLQKKKRKILGCVPCIKKRETMQFGSMYVQLDESDVCLVRCQFSQMYGVLYFQNEIVVQFRQFRQLDSLDSIDNLDSLDRESSDVASPVPRRQCVCVCVCVTSFFLKKKEACREVREDVVAHCCVRRALLAAVSSVRYSRCHCIESPKKCVSIRKHT